MQVIQQPQGVTLRPGLMTLAQSRSYISKSSRPTPKHTVVQTGKHFTGNGRHGDFGESHDLILFLAVTMILFPPGVNMLCIYCVVLWETGSPAHQEQHPEQHPSLFNPLPFAFRTNRPTDDAVSIGLHPVLTHLEKNKPPTSECCLLISAHHSTQSPPCKQF